jgi:hypothetical protein
MAAPPLWASLLGNDCNSGRASPGRGIPEADVDVAMLAAAIDAINDCAQACIADTDVDLSG